MSTRAESRRTARHRSTSRDRDSDKEDYDVLHLAKQSVGRQDSSHHGTLPSGKDATQQQLYAELTLPMYEADLVQRPSDEAEQQSSVWYGKNVDDTDVVVHTDRFDALHLLDKIPRLSDDAEINACEDAMSDLDSDAEDVFFLEDAELAAYRHEKQQRILADVRQKRIDAIEAEEAALKADRAKRKAAKVAVSQGSDVTLEQFNLMKRTAAALRGADNASTLMMRILANHGGDVRFAFLRRGKEQRWADVWSRLMAGEDLTYLLQDDIVESDGKKISLLSQSYDTDSGDEEVTVTENAKDAVGPNIDTEGAQAAAPAASANDEDIETRRKRKLALAHEWSRKRREAAGAEKSKA